jgi:hypothetical protein
MTRIGTWNFSSPMSVAGPNPRKPNKIRDFLETYRQIENIRTYTELHFNLLSTGGRYLGGRGSLFFIFVNV